MITSGTIGSRWRIWDLHVHSPASNGGSYKAFIENAKQSKAEVIGINDYCTLEGYKTIIDLGGIQGKILFPVVEFRMNNIVANRKSKQGNSVGSGAAVNFHIIFDNDPTFFEKINTFINSLECYGNDGKTTQLGSVAKSDLAKLTFNFSDVRKRLRDLGLYKEHALVWLPYDEYGGIDDIDPDDNFFKLGLIQDCNIIGSSTQKQIDFFKGQHERYSADDIKKMIGHVYPCIKGSDAHKVDYPFGCLQDKNSQPTDRYCWIKADTTFKGLQQILIEPDRVFIGEEPVLLVRERTSPTKFIGSLSVRNTSEVNTDDPTWFDNFSIDFNSSLIAIIGNKGGGKSAITDILSLCGNTHQDPLTFSFLEKKKFRRPKPENLSEKYEATLTWKDSTNSIAQLSTNPNTSVFARVRYIPQNFLERLCAEIEPKEFEKELKQIIYSHTPIDKRQGKDSLDELIEDRSSVIIADLLRIQSDISKVNREIIALESKTTNEHKALLESHLSIKNSELVAHMATKPTEPPQVATTEENKDQFGALSILRQEIAAIELEIEEVKKNRSVISASISELEKAKTHFESLNSYLLEVSSPNEIHVAIINKFGISTDKVLSYSINTAPIEEEIAQLTENLAVQDKILLPLTASDHLSNPDNLLSKLLVKKENLAKLADELDKPAREYQSYLNIFKTWEDKRKSIEGDRNTEDSIAYLNSQLDYLREILPTELSNRIELRDSQSLMLLKKKLQLVAIRTELFKPVSQFILEHDDLTSKYDVQLNVSLVVSSLADNFFGFINQQRKGTFASTNDGFKLLTEMYERVHFDSETEALAFANSLVDCLQNNKSTQTPEKTDILSQLRKGKNIQDLYDYIFHFEYLVPTYSLKLGNKAIEELSPGERGALLLIFYLFLDKDDIPLIIDQPEENLDNESVYHLLVHFIKKIKEQRQIFIVTHNPNLAIVCDADQVVHMNIEKDKNNRVVYYSGAIEDPEMNRRIINILEGTLPAFDNRDHKYYR